METVELVEKLVKELRKLRDDIKSQEDQRLYNKLTELYVGWYNILQCLKKNCEFIVNERFNAITVKAPVELTIGIDPSVSVSELFNIVRDKIIDVFYGFIIETEVSISELEKAENAKDILAKLEDALRKNH
ncbi:MAG: hypothetical protein QXM43_05695 [Desulfurococcaceae archaeon]